MADGVDIDLYSDDIDQGFGQMKVRNCLFFMSFVLEKGKKEIQIN